MKEIKLPSGAKLKIDMAPFAVSKALYQACLVEFKTLNLDPKTELDVNFFKDVICSALSSDIIEKAIWECLKRATYDGVKITEATFEDSERRGDYVSVMFEVAKENVMPFMSNLYAQYGPELAKLQKSLA